jgi:hypothetical protein
MAGLIFLENLVIMKAALIGLSAALIAGVAQAEGAGSLKPGLWEVRTLKMTIDGADILPQMKAAQEQMRRSMASMPPEQRKQMEATMGAQDGDPTVQRVCVSPEMAKNEQAVLPQRPANSDCAAPKLNRSGDRMTFELSCKHGAGATVMKGESVTAGERVTSKVESVSTEPGGAKHTMQTEMQMQFIGSDCGGLKPADQIAREMRAGAAGRPAARRK